MRGRPLLRLLCAAALLGAAVSSGAALAAGGSTFSGRISIDPSGLPLVGAEVRLWAQGSGVPPATKGYSILRTTAADANGNYSFTGIAPGSYKVDARMGAGTVGDYGDRWYDVAPPVTPPGGYVPGDADVLVVPPQGQDLTGLNIALQAVGGIDASVASVSPTALVAGIRVRAELTSDARVHHNDASQADPHLGQVYFRGLVPGTYRLIAHSLDGSQDTTILEGVGVAAGAVTAAGPLVMNAMPANPYAGNQTLATGYPLAYGLPHQVFFNSDAQASIRITDLLTGNGTVDTFCFNSAAGDRYLVQALTPLVRGAGPYEQEDPWGDPVIAFFRGVNATSAALTDDDSSTAFGYSRGAFFDTHEIVTATERDCVAVSTYGDVTFTGLGHQSAGRYALQLQLGNRRPHLVVSTGGSVAPDLVSIKEGDTVEFDVVYTDPDNDPLGASVLHVGVDGVTVADGTYTRTGNTAAYVWTASYTARRKSPYTLTFAVNDAELTTTRAITLNVLAVNIPPTLPVQLSPASSSRLGTNTPTLVVANSTDVNQDPLSYDFEIRDGAANLLQSYNVAQGPGGQTQVTLAPLLENQTVYWRARANDGHLNDNCCSPWTDSWNLLVDTGNDPPAVPLMIKPADNEVVDDRHPALEATSVADPEGDAVTLLFQVSTDQAFPSPLVAAPVADVNTVGPVTTAALGALLDWGTSYSARVRAVDARGSVSAWSAPVSFSVRAGLPPGQPQLVGPFQGACQAHAFRVGPPPTIQVSRVVDPEGGPVVLEVELFPFSADPGTAAPLYAVHQPQAALGSDTAVDISQFTAWTEDAHYLVRARASDGTLTSAWTACDFTLNLVTPLPDGGIADGGGVADGGGGIADGGAGDGGAVDGGGDGGDGGPLSDGGSGGGGDGGPGYSSDGGSDAGAGGGATVRVSDRSCGCASGGDFGTSLALLSLLGTALRMRRRQR